MEDVLVNGMEGGMTYTCLNVCQPPYLIIDHSDFPAALVCPHGGGEVVPDSLLTASPSETS